MIVCRHVLLLPQESVATQARIATSVFVAVRFVVVFMTCTVTALQESLSDGSSKLQAAPAGIVRSGWQISVGGVMSRTVILCVQEAALPHRSAAIQVRVTTLVPPQRLLTESKKARATELHPSTAVAGPVLLVERSV